MAPAPFTCSKSAIDDGQISGVALLHLGAIFTGQTRESQLARVCISQHNSLASDALTSMGRVEAPTAIRSCGMARKVWFQLVGATTRGAYADTQTASVQSDSANDIDDLRKAIREKYRHDRPDILEVL
ncbi:hypothetical protein ON010_g16839 [Phytophthora cinnamomi]|nr:hypothetical protein ON010_g16839 [Phytophthora cinnamomi]